MDTPQNRPLCASRSRALLPVRRSTDESFTVISSWGRNLEKNQSSLNIPLSVCVNNRRYAGECGWGCPRQAGPLISTDVPVEMETCHSGTRVRCHSRKVSEHPLNPCETRGAAGFLHAREPSAITACEVCQRCMGMRRLGCCFTPVHRMSSTHWGRRMDRYMSLMKKLMGF